ncbi:glucuronate isomerase [Enterococcus songbeiensis]
MFLDQDFLLKNDTAKKLYHDYVEKMPVIDYHCHLEPKEIYDNGKFKNITQAWLGGDHYKWRLMRANGVDEELITGNASDYDKFLAWAETIEECIGNPLYVWTHLELKRIFGIEELLTKETAPTIWEKANLALASEKMTTRNIIKAMQVKVICTTDDPISDLTYHKKLAEEESAFQVFPTFRPDKVIAIDAEEFIPYLEKLAELTSHSVTTYKEMIAALKHRIQFFHDAGCRLSDHSFTALVGADVSQKDLEEIFAKRCNNQSLTEKEIANYHFGLLCDLMKLYAEQGWTCQLHLLATRSNNSQLFEKLGPDVGGDGMNDEPIVAAIAKVFDYVNREDKLPKTILYSLNPKDFISLTTLMGCFQSDVKGKIQLGAAWWFNDSYSGMRHQLTTLAEGGILGNFVGMLTDSRSFLSYPRHEYFRRILCELVSEWVEQDQLPSDVTVLGPKLAKIAYTNAENYFGFNK